MLLLSESNSVRFYIKDRHTEDEDDFFLLQGHPAEKPSFFRRVGGQGLNALYITYIKTTAIRAYIIIFPMPIPEGSGTPS